MTDLPNEVRVEGHTDNVPINTFQFPSNWHLSVARSMTTAYYLIERHHLRPEKISVVGYGEYRPIADNISSDGRGKNRRVDIVILATEIPLQKPVSPIRTEPELHQNKPEHQK
jgi:chemotaxis protein MotB